MVVAVEYIPVNGKIIEVIDVESLDILLSNDNVILILEVPYSISHWDLYELSIFYQWIMLYQRYLPINLDKFIDIWINEERYNQFNIIATLIEKDSVCLEDIEIHGELPFG